MRVGWIIIGTLLWLTFTSCGQGPLFEEKQEISNAQWTLDDTIRFQAILSDTAQWYDVFLNVHHLPEFTYQNLYVKAITVFPDGSAADQILSLQLADEFGVWEGECSGKSCIAPVTLSEKVQIPQPGEYEFKFIQYSRQDTLDGISALGLEIFRFPVAE